VREVTERGQFWLPDSPGTKVSGVYEFVPGEGGRLSLIGKLTSPTNRELRTFPRVVGEITSSGHIALENCFVTRSTFGFGGLDEETSASDLLCAVRFIQLTNHSCSIGSPSA
jgi:hypothetical protein